MARPRYAGHDATWAEPGMGAERRRRISEQADTLKRRRDAARASSATRLHDRPRLEPSVRHVTVENIRNTTIRRQPDRNAVISLYLLEPRDAWREQGPGGYTSTLRRATIKSDWIVPTSHGDPSKSSDLRIPDDQTIRLSIDPEELRELAAETTRGPGRYMLPDGESRIPLTLDVTPAQLREMNAERESAWLDKIHYDTAKKARQRDTGGKPRGERRGYPKGRYGRQGTNDERQPSM